MSRASREAAAIAANEAYFESIREMPDPEWAEVEHQPETDLHPATGAEIKKIDIVGVAVLQRGNPSWSTNAIEEAHQAAHRQQEQEYQERQQAITETYLADPLDTTNPVPDALLFAEPNTPLVDSQPEIEAFYDSPNAAFLTHRQALSQLTEGQQAKFDDNLSALITFDTRDTVSSLPNVGAMPLEPTIVNGRVIEDALQSKPVDVAKTVNDTASEADEQPLDTTDTTASLPQVGAMPTAPQLGAGLTMPRVHSLHNSIGQGYAFTKQLAGEQRTPTPLEAEAVVADPGAALVDRINTLANTAAPVTEQQEAIAPRTNIPTAPTAETIISDIRQQQESPQEDTLGRVLAGLRRSRERDLQEERQQQLREASAIIDERTLIDNPRAVGETVFKTLGLTVALEIDEVGNKTQRVVRNPDGSILLSTDMRQESRNENYLLRTKSGVRRFLGRVASALGGNVRVTRG